ARALETQGRAGWRPLPQAIALTSFPPAEISPPAILSESPRACNARAPASLDRLSGLRHAILDVRVRPAGHGCERVRFRPVASRQRCTVAIGRRTGRFAGPGMAQDVAALKVRAVACLQEHEVLREGLGVVADVHAGHEHRVAVNRSKRALVLVSNPTHAELD